MSHDDYAVEPVPGLPERPPDDEVLIWQGAPRWRSLAVHAFHARKVAIYFALIWLIFLVIDIPGGRYWAAATTGFWLFVPALVAVALLSAIAWLSARMTIYSITSRRVVIRSGIALPMSINVPFAQIESAQCKKHRDGTVDLPVRVARGQNSSFVILWPNVRPWRFARPEPMLRCVVDGQRAADVLSQALADHMEPKTSLPRLQPTGRTTADNGVTDNQRAIA